MSTTVLTGHTMCSVRGHDGPREFGFSLIAVFIACWQTKPCQFRNQQSRTGAQVATHGSIWDSWPIAFSGYPRGPRVCCETTCPKHTAPAILAETRSRTRVSREADGQPPEKIPGMERTRSETLKLFVVSDDWRRSTLLSSRRSERSWQFFWLRSAAPFPAACLWPLKRRKTLRTGPAWSRRRPRHS